MTLEEYKAAYDGADSDSAPGWDAIDSRLREVYGEQEPKHWGTLVSAALGGPDPLDGISAYACTKGGVDHLHFVTYGFSELYYDEEAVGGEFSKFGFEMSIRLASPLPPTEEPNWVLNLLQNLARYVFKSGKWFEPYHWVPANGPIRANHDTALVGLVFLPDPVVGPIDTVHGRVEFLQAFGITEPELRALMEGTRSSEEIIEQHGANNPLLVTDPARQK